MVSREYSIANIILFLIVVLIFSSILVRYQYIFLPPGTLDDGVIDNFIFLILREVCWLVLGGISFFIILKNKQKTLYFIFLAFLILILTVRNILQNNLDTLIYGFRVLLVFLAFPSVSYMCEKLDFDKINKVFQTVLKIIIVILIPIVFYQSKFFPSTYGATFLGARVNGFYSNPIAFSMFLASISLILFVLKSGKYRFWMIVCIFLSLFTGGRAGILVNIILLLMSYFSYLTKNKVSIFILFSLISPVIFLIISSADISGREATSDNGFKDGRLEVWEGWISKLNHNISDFIFGIQIGAGTNAGVRFSSGDVTDSMFVMFLVSFGLIGVVVLLMSILYYLFKLKDKAFVSLLVAISFSVAQNLPEVNPLNIMVMFSIIYSYNYNIYERNQSKGLTS